MSEVAGPERDTSSVREAARDVPDVGTPVHLLLEGASWPSRVEGAERDSFRVATPSDNPVLEVGQEIDVFWVVPGSRIMLPCRLTEISEGTPRRWTLVPTADARHADRRQHPRGGALAWVKLRAEASDASGKGALVDISQGGLRCWIDDALPLVPGDPVRVTVWLGTREAQLNTVVHAVREIPEGGTGRHLILTFEAQDETAWLIRQYITAWEIGERRRG